MKRLSDYPDTYEQLVALVMRQQGVARAAAEQWIREHQPRATGPTR